MRLCVLLLCVFKLVDSQSCRENDPRDMAGVCKGLCDRMENCTIKAALLLPQNTKFYANLPAVRSVFDLALADAAVTQYLPPWLTMELATYDVLDCDPAHALLTAIDAYNDCSHVFFGTACEFALASMGRLTRFLGSTGTPLITTGGFSYDFVKPKQSCSDEFYMLVRTGPPGFKDLAYFFIALFRRFKWKQTLLITEADAQMAVAGNSTCYLTMKSFANYLKEEKIHYTSWEKSSAFKNPQNYSEDLKHYLGPTYSS